MSATLLIAVDARSATSAGEFGTFRCQKNEPLGGGVGLAIVGSSDAEEIASLSMPNCHALCALSGTDQSVGCFPPLWSAGAAGGFTWGASASDTVNNTHRCRVQHDQDRGRTDPNIGVVPPRRMRYV